MAKVERALMLGIDKTTSEGTIDAKRLVNRDTTTLQGSIFPEPAKVNGSGQVEGVYGPHDVEYAKYQEFLPGETMPDGQPRRRKGGKPYMRPSMRTVEKNLAPNIQAAYRGLP
jgi:hypothetical protein